MSETWNRALPVVPPLFSSAPTSTGAARHDPVERGDDRLEGDERRQPLDVGARGIERRLLGIGIALLLVVRLLRDDRLPDERMITPRRHGRELGIRLRIGEVGLGLHELLIEIGRVDVREDVAALHLGADVLVPSGDVAAGARVNGRRGKRLNVARQHDVLRRGTSLRRHERDARHGLFLRPGAEFLLAAGATTNAGEGDEAGSDKNDQTTQDEAPGARLANFRQSVFVSGHRLLSRVWAGPTLGDKRAAPVAGGTALRTRQKSGRVTQRGSGRHEFSRTD